MYSILGTEEKESSTFITFLTRSLREDKEEEGEKDACKTSKHQSTKYIISFITLITYRSMVNIEVAASK